MDSYLVPSGEGMPNLLLSVPSLLIENRSTGMISRSGSAWSLKKGRKSHGCSLEKKISISSGGIDCWYDDFYGITRVAVHGLDSICVVTRKQDLMHLILQEVVAKQIDPNNENALLSMFTNAIIYEVEDLACPFDIPFKMFEKSIEKPCAVVSVIPPSTKMGQKVSSHEQASGADYDVERAVKFLHDVLKSKVALTFHKTVTTAIYALQHLFGKKFNADEIQVFVCKCGKPSLDEMMKHARGEILHVHDEAYELLVRGELCVKDYLAVINKQPHD